MTAAWRVLERWLLGENLSGDSGGTDTTLQATWEAPAGLVCLLLFVAAAILIWVYWHEHSVAGRSWKVFLACIRALLIGLVVLMLYGWTVQRHRTDLPDAVIVLDDSASMSLVDRQADTSLAAAIKERLSRLQLDEPTRLNLAKALLLENDGALLAALSRNYNLRFYLAGGSSRAVGGDSREIRAALRQAAAIEPASRLGNCLQDVLEAQRGRPTAAIILLTDGITTDGKSLIDAAKYSRRKAIPLFLVGLGSDRAPRDLWLADLLSEDTAFVGDLLHFEAKVLAQGYTGAATVRLTVAGGPSESQPSAPVVLDQREVRLDQAGAAQTVQLSHRAETAGEFEYTVEILPQDGEVNVENNRLTRKVVVREQTIRVLLVQAYPSYEFRFLKQMLLRELNAHQSEEGKAAGIRTVLQEADPEYVESDKTAERVFPVSREELFQYDVLILGDVNPALLSPSVMNNIVDFVTVRGGGVIFIAGPRYMPAAFQGMPLATLFPCDLNTVSVPDPSVAITDAFRPTLTPLGLASPHMQIADTRTTNEKLWRGELTPIRWFASIPDLRPGVRVLAEHPTRRTDTGSSLPIICLQFVGAGKVVFHATDETHRWRFRVGDVYFARYWVQTIRYLCRAKLLAGSRSAELTTDRDQYRRGDAVALRVRFLDDRLAPAQDVGVVVVVEHGGGQRRSVNLQRHAADRGVFEGSAGPLSDGQYRAWLASPTLPGQPPSHEFTVMAPPGELARTQMDSAELSEAAKVSAGKFYTYSTAGRLLADLPRGRHVRVESLPPEPIWNAPLFAGLFVVLITAEWLLRKRLGML